MARAATVVSAELTLDANYEFVKTSGGAALIITPNPRENTEIVITAAFDGAGTDNIEIQIVGGPRISTGNTLDGTTTASDYELDTVADGFAADDDRNGQHLIMTSNDEEGEGRLIIDSVAADDGVVFSHAFSAQSAAGESYDLYAFGVLQEGAIVLADPAEDEPNTFRTVVGGESEFIAIKIRVSGATDTPKITLRYTSDGVSA